MRSGPASGEVVLVDMDGVLADFDRAVLERLPADVERVERSEFYIVRDYPAHRDHVEAIYSDPRFFDDLHPVDSAVEGWQSLLDLGYRPRVCTAPLTLNPRSVEGKTAWLRHHLVPWFGERVVADAIFDKRKFAHDGVVLIDDRPDVDTGGGRAPWAHVVFDRTYNRRAVSPHRILGWADPDLAEVLAAARRNR